MKITMRGFTLLLLLLCVQILFAAPCGAAADVSGDGTINIVDALQTAQYYTDLPDPASQPTSTYSETIEAEDFEDLGCFYIGTLNGASGESVIVVARSGSQCTATTTFTGPSGTYTVTVRYFDSDDGNGPFGFTVNSTLIGAWTGDVENNAFNDIVFTDIQINNGDTLQLEAEKNGDRGRIDYVLITSGDATVPTIPINGDLLPQEGNPIHTALDNYKDYLTGDPVEDKLWGDIIVSWQFVVNEGAFPKQGFDHL